MYNTHTRTTRTTTIITITNATIVTITTTAPHGYRWWRTGAIIIGSSVNFLMLILFSGNAPRGVRRTKPTSRLPPRMPPSLDHPRTQPSLDCPAPTRFWTSGALVDPPSPSPSPRSQHFPSRPYHLQRDLRLQHIHHVPHPGNAHNDLPFWLCCGITFADSHSFVKHRRRTGMCVCVCVCVHMCARACVFQSVVGDLLRCRARVVQQLMNRLSSQNFGRAASSH